MAVLTTNTPPLQSVIVPQNSQDATSKDNHFVTAWMNFFVNLARAVPMFGQGDPSGVVVANCGKLYIDITGGAGLVLYVKEDPANNNTANGWAAK